MWRLNNYKSDVKLKFDFIFIMNSYACERMNTLALPSNSTAVILWMTDMFVFKWH